MLAIILNAVGLICVVVASLYKGNKMAFILMMVSIGNLLAATSMLIDGEGINGAISGFLGCAIGLINYFFQIKSKKIPLWLIGIYAASFIVANLIVQAVWYAVFAIAACLCFIMSLIQNSGAGYRLWSIGNTALWVTYDIVSGAYVGLITHGGLLLVMIFGLLVLDLKEYRKNATGKGVSKEEDNSDCELKQAE